MSRKVHDVRLLRLIGRYLRAGVMVEGVLQPTDEGSPQGGPLSPLLSNILLDDLDKELERRRLKFVRYADDFHHLRAQRTKCPASVRVGPAISDAASEARGERAEEQRETGPRLRIPRVRICW